MSSIRSENTRLEAQLISILLDAKITRFTRHEKTLPGKPDMAFKQAKLVIFFDSCFWHACPKHFRRPKSNTVYWKAKIEKNKERDRSQRSILRQMGWRVIRVWEHELKHPKTIIRKLRKALASQCG
jgi:DNA mismatch endonuclease (patch repair protein)